MTTQNKYYGEVKDEGFGPRREIYLALGIEQTGQNFPSRGELQVNLELSP